MVTADRSTARKERLPRYRRAEAPPPMHLTSRDEELLSWVYELRFATQEHLQTLLFAPSTGSSCKRRLTLLYHNGYLDRRLIPLRSRFGANRAAYCLDRRGAALLAFHDGASPLDWRPRDNDRELYFLEHTLSSNEVRICVTLAAREQGYVLTWVSERALRSRAMRDFVTDPKHPDRRLAVIPDGYFQLSTDTAPMGFALELDRGTVSEKPFKAKVRALGEWKVTGTYRRRFNTDSLRVLFVVAPNDRDPNRLARIRAWTQAEGGQSLFWFAHLAALTPATIFSAPVWQIAGRSGGHSLID